MQFSIKIMGLKLTPDLQKSSPQNKIALYFKNGWTWTFIIVSCISIISVISIIWNQKWILIPLSSSVFLLFFLFFYIGTTNIREKYFKAPKYPSDKVPSWKQVYNTWGFRKRYLKENLDDN